MSLSIFVYKDLDFNLAPLMCTLSLCLSLSPPAPPLLALVKQLPHCELSCGETHVMKSWELPTEHPTSDCVLPTMPKWSWE